MAGELVGIIGGTGLGDALAGQLSRVEFREVETPFGKPSGPILRGELGNRRIAFVNRHGEGHKIPPSRVPYAANIFALKSLGVHAVIASGAVGSLREKIAPGNLVLVNQFIDKTFKRRNTFFDGFGAVHCEMSEPVCSRLKEVLVHVGHAPGGHDPPRRHLRLHGGSAVLDAGGVADASPVGRRPDRHDRDAGG